MERRFAVLNLRDIETYTDQESIDKMRETIANVLSDVEDGRVKDGKSPYNEYLVINVDESYASEVIEIMKRYGHWG